MAENQIQNPQPVAQPQANSSYSAEYVKALRDEAASWRTKLRETEGSLNTLQAEVKTKDTHELLAQELIKTGVNANPAWVQVKEGQSAADAVKAFAAEYPHLVGQPQPQAFDTGNQIPTPAPQSVAQNNPQPMPLNELDAIRQDPIARAKLRDHYRAIIAQNNGKDLRL